MGAKKLNKVSLTCRVDDTTKNKLDTLTTTTGISMGKMIDLLVNHVDVYQLIMEKLKNKFED
jgi:antitoxin component of RelBE/YafQ-DinJ toxin-antitoxin module